MGPGSGFYYLLYNEQPTEGCDLKDMYETYFRSGSLFSIGGLYKKAQLDDNTGAIVHPAGWLSDDISGFSNVASAINGSESPGLYQTGDCNFRLIAVKSTGDIPADAWPKLGLSDKAPAAGENSKQQQTVQDAQSTPADPTPAPNPTPATSAPVLPSGATPKAVEQSVRDAVNRWVNAFRARDTLALAECYAPVLEKYFRRDNIGRDHVQRYIQDSFARMVDILRYEVSNIQVTKLPADAASTNSVVYSRATATFNKAWETTQSDGKTFSGEEIEQLTLASSPDGWKIVREEELKVLRASKR